MDKVKKVCVLCGGESSERDVSLKSGQFIYKSLLNLGYQAELIDFIESNYIDFSKLKKNDQGMYIEQDDLAIWINKKLRKFDLVFIALHGAEGEMGYLQEEFEKYGINYTGSNEKACRDTWNKRICKDILKKNNIPTPKYEEFWTGDQSIIESADRLKEKFKNGAFMKPTEEGSSIDIFKITNFSKENLKKIMSQLSYFNQVVIIEEFIDGREFTVGFLNDQILEPLEIVTDREFYDYFAKYHDDDTQITKADLSKDKIKELKMIAKKSFEVLGLSVWGRVDIMQDKRGNFFVLEINTVPGMTDHSLFPYAAKLNGLSFDELVDEIASQ
tara:strand:- start:1632 stop:2618 length:987 start_codon:yes stop_codon:yes gene_type:complete